jgi:hypothetical protein
MRQLPLVLAVFTGVLQFNVLALDPTNALAIVNVRLRSAKESTTKNAHEVLVTITNLSSQVFKDEGPGRYVVFLMRVDGSSVNELLVSSSSRLSNRMGIGGGYVREIPPQSSFGECICLEEELRLGRAIPLGDYWLLMIRKCGLTWDQVIPSEPVRIKIE